MLSPVERSKSTDNFLEGAEVCPFFVLEAFRSDFNSSFTLKKQFSILHKVVGNEQEIAVESGKKQASRQQQVASSCYRFANQQNTMLYYSLLVMLEVFVTEGAENGTTS